MFLKRLFNFIPKDEYSYALDLFNTGHYRKALKKFESLLSRSDDQSDMDVKTLELYACEAHVALGKEHSDNGDISEAIKEMEQAVALKPQFADLRYTLGTLYKRSKDYQNSRDMFKAALEINEKFFKARINLARVLLMTGDNAEAAKELETAKQHCPNFYKKVLNDLVQAVRIKSDEDKVVEFFHGILEEQPSSSQISRELAIEYIQNGHNTEAIRELKKSISFQPDYPDLHNYLGIAYGNNGMVDDSMEEFEIALKINPYYLKARLNLALVLYENGRYPEARNNIDAVLKVQPENQLANNLLKELETVGERK